MNNQNGIIFHWGLYSVATFDNNTKTFPNTKNYHSIGSRNVMKKYHQIVLDNHDALKADFDNVIRDFDFDSLFRMLVNKNIDYIILTAKYYDGFCLWNTETTVAKSENDLVNLIVKTAEKYKIKVGLYYSWSEYGKSMTKDYMNQVVIPQINELKQYKPFYWWFDGECEIKTKFAKNIVRDIVLELRKDTLVNSSVSEDGPNISMENMIIFGPTLDGELDQRKLSSYRDNEHTKNIPQSKVIRRKTITNKNKTSETYTSRKLQRKTRNLGINTTNTQEESYLAIEAKIKTAKCFDGNHHGERILPIRKFYLNKGGKSIQGACIVCQKQRRANRITRSRTKFIGKTKQEIYDIYVTIYGQTKTCSKCKTPKPPCEFPISISMETGLHNHCNICSIGNSQGNSDLRNFIFLPDKDGIKYTKKDKCEKCGGSDRLAIDHILPIAKGGNDCLINKQTLCIHCNCKKSDTIESIVNPSLLCDRYKDDTLVFTDNIRLSQILSKKVYEFKKDYIDDSSLEKIRITLKEYAKKYNLGHNLDRIVRKIAIAFNKV
jgi:hypothetical protein